MWQRLLPPAELRDLPSMPKRDWLADAIERASDDARAAGYEVGGYDVEVDRDGRDIVSVWSRRLTGYDRLVWWGRRLAKGIAAMPGAVGSALIGASLTCLVISIVVGLPIMLLGWIITFISKYFGGYVK